MILPISWSLMPTLTNFSTQLETTTRELYFSAETRPKPRSSWLPNFSFKMVKKKGSPISTLNSWWFFTNPFETQARPSNRFPFPPQGFQGWKSGLQPQDSRTKPTPMPSNIVIPNLGFAMKRLSQQNSTKCVPNGSCHLDWMCLPVTVANYRFWSGFPY